MPNYDVIDGLSDELLQTRKKVTVVTEEDSDGLLIQDYQYGKPVNDGEYHGVADLDDSILNYPFRGQVFVDSSIASKFDCLIHQAEVYRECDGDLDKISEVLDNEDMPDCDEYDEFD